MWKLSVLCVTFFTISSASETKTLAAGNGKVTSSNFETFQRCLVNKGIPPSSFVSSDTDSTLYHELNQPWQLKPPATAPLAFILVRNEADIIATVLCSKSLSIRLIPKGGGHSFEKYSFGDESSVVIDLRALDDVKVNLNEGTATIGPGNLASPLSWKLWSLAQVLVPLTVCPTVGISTGLGGGIGSFVGTYGLTLDQILETRVVLANGSVVVANTNKNDDLYWALRGGGATSFGIVTQFVFRTFPAPQNIFEGIVTFDITQFANVMNVWQFYILPDVRPNSVTTQITGVTSTSFLFKFIDVNGNDLEFQKLLNFLPLPVTVVKTIQTYPEFIFQLAKNGVTNHLLNPNVNLTEPKDLLNINRSYGPKLYQKSKSFFIQKIVGISELTALQNLLLQKPSTILLFLDSFGGAVRSIGVNETSFVHRGSTLIFAAAIHSTPFPNDTTNSIGHAFVEEFFNIGKLFYNHPETYQNYAEGDLPDYLDRYYGTNLEKLIQVKRKYDPENFFQYPQSIPLQLPS